MTDRIVIRPARDGDKEFVAAFVSSLLEFGSPAWEDSAALAPGFREVLASAVNAKEPRAKVLIAEDVDGNRLGFISLKVGRDIAGVERGHVADVAVSESSRRMGVGAALMAAGEAWAREHGLTMLSLDVWSTNERALSFYRSIGYVAESLCLIKRLD
jgi:ribosomal protein S18 acetylase RimI-like enzyme